MSGPGGISRHGENGQARRLTKVIGFVIGGIDRCHIVMAVRTASSAGSWRHVRAPMMRIHGLRAGSSVPFRAGRASVCRADSPAPILVRCCYRRGSRSPQAPMSSANMLFPAIFRQEQTDRCRRGAKIQEKRLRESATLPARKQWPRRHHRRRENMANASKSGSRRGCDVTEYLLSGWRRCWSPMRWACRAVLIHPFSGLLSALASVCPRSSPRASA